MERSARAWWLSESRRAPRRVSGSPPQNAVVADAARETVRVEPLEQELGVTSAGAREIAKASERDLARAPALGEQKILRRLVRVDPDRIAVAEPNEASGRLEVARKRVFADLRRPRTCARELAFERTRFFLASAERRDGTGEVELRPAPLERQQRDHVRSPPLCGNRNSRIERVGARELLSQCSLELREPRLRERPRACVPKTLGLAVEQMPKRVREDRRMDRSRHVTALDERHPPRVAVAGWRGIEDDSSAESRLPADDHMIAAGRNHRRRKAQLGPALAGSNDTSRHVRRSEICEETVPVP